MLRASTLSNIIYFKSYFIYVYRATLLLSIQKERCCEFFLNFSVSSLAFGKKLHPLGCSREKRNAVGFHSKNN